MKNGTQENILSDILKFTPYILILITIIVFFPTFYNDFQKGWDDGWILLDNPYVVDSSIKSIQYHLSHFFVGQYSPINTIVYIVIYKLFGFNPMAYHIMCLLIHIMNVCLVYSIIKQTVGALRLDFKLKRVNLYAFFCGFNFCNSSIASGVCSLD